MASSNRNRNQNTAPKAQQAVEEVSTVEEVNNAEGEGVDPDVPASEDLSLSEEERESAAFVAEQDAQRKEAVNAPQGQVTRTNNFYGSTVSTPADIEDLGVEVIENDANRYEVVVTEDVGPVFYGSEEVEMKKNTRYLVPYHIYQYLDRRALVYSAKKAS